MIRKYSIPSGMTTSRNQWTLYVMAARIPIMAMKQKSRFCRLIGSIVSTASISWEKRLMIRPEGVVSKKLIGQRTVVCRRLVWRVREAAIVLTMYKTPKSTMDVTVKETMCNILDCSICIIVIVLYINVLVHYKQFIRCSCRLQYIRLYLIITDQRLHMMTIGITRYEL
jgi:hypothetical protein